MGGGASICFDHKKEEPPIYDSRLIIDTHVQEIVAQDPVVSTPRSCSYEIGVDCTSDTPMKPQDRELFKYFCPMCFQWWKNHVHVLICGCCKNNICVSCTIDFLASKRIEATTVGQILDPATQPVFRHIHCPNCNTEGFTPELVDPFAPPRNYLDSPQKPERTVGMEPVREASPPSHSNAPTVTTSFHEQLEKASLEPVDAAAESHARVVLAHEVNTHGLNDSANASGNGNDSAPEPAEDGTADSAQVAREYLHKVAVGFMHTIMMGYNKEANSIVNAPATRAQ